MNSCDLSVIIPSTGNSISLNRILRSISTQELESLRIEIILVLNGIERSVYENLSRQFTNSNTTVLYSEPIGVNRARNRGLCAATGKIIVFLDDDCQISHDYYFVQHFGFHVNHPTVFAFGGGYMCAPDSKYFDQLYNRIQMRWLNRISFAVDVLSDDSIQRTESLLGGNFSLKKDLLERFSLKFDDSIIYGGSETEFFRASNDKGLSLVKGAGEVIHHTHETLLSLHRKLVRQGAGHAYIDKKYQLQMAKESNLRNTIAADFIERYFGYVFWFGYYRENRKTMFLIVHLIRDFWGTLQFYRFKTFDAIKTKVDIENNRGRRF